MQDKINFLVESAVAIISTSRYIISQFGFPTSGIKPFYFKDMTRGKIGFHSRTDRNHSDLLYNMCEGGTYVETPFFAIGFSSEQFVYNVAVHLRMKNSIKIGYSLSWACKGAPQLLQVVC